MVTPATSGAETPATAAPTVDDPVDPSAVPAALEPIRAAGSEAAAATETVHLVEHSGRLFAGLGRWMAPEPFGAPILVKDDETAAWQTFAVSEAVRVTALSSFEIPGERNGGTPVDVLLAHVVTGREAQIVWLRDDATAFEGSFGLGARQVEIRSFGAHVDGGEFFFFAGSRPNGLLRGRWDAASQTIVWDPAAELTIDGDTGERKVTGMAECGGALYATLHTRLFRRNDGTLADGVDRWVEVFSRPPVAEGNSGLRGLTCIEHDGKPALLMSLEGPGTIVRFDDLPAGTYTTPLADPTIELQPPQLIGDTLRSWGVDVPIEGAGSVGYVIAAYNDFTPVDSSAGPVLIAGIEFAYRDRCADGRTCQLSKQFDTTACYLVRGIADDTPDYEMRCLGGPDLTPTGPNTRPVATGEAFVATRDVLVSPFGDGQVYLGGYDANSVPSDGTAWVATASTAALVP